jgi:hypothetical protein
VTIILLSEIAVITIGIEPIMGLEGEVFHANISCSAL